jgi:hypothetical protein
MPISNDVTQQKQSHVFKQKWSEDGFIAYLRYVGRLLYLSRISLISCIAGFSLFTLAPQAQDLFLDLRSPHLGWIIYWTLFYLCLFLFWIFPVYASADFMIRHGNDHPLAETDLGQKLSKPIPLLLALICLAGVGIAQYEAWGNISILVNTTPVHPDPTSQYVTVWTVPETAVLLLVTVEAVFLFLSFQIYPPERNHLTTKYLLRNLTLILVIFLLWLAWYYHYIDHYFGDDEHRAAKKVAKDFLDERATWHVLLAPIAICIVWTLVRSFINGFVDWVRRRGYVAAILYGMTAIVFLILVVVNPLYVAAIADRALLLPVVLGAWVPGFTYLALRTATSGVPIIISSLFAVAAVSAYFNLHRFESNQISNSEKQWDLQDALHRWKELNNCASTSPEKKDCPELILIGAQGGASRSAFYTASVLGKFADDSGEFRNRIFAMSGVSGGSVGLAIYSAALKDAQKADIKGDAYRHPPCQSLTKLKAQYGSGPAWNWSGFSQWFGAPLHYGTLPRQPGGDYADKWQDCLEVLASGDFLSPVFIRMMGVDFLGLNWLGAENRAAVLERAWERHFERITVPKEQRDEKNVRGLQANFLQAAPRQDAQASWRPLLLLNATEVRTGRRVVASHLNPWYCHGEKGAAKRLLGDAYDLHELLSIPKNGYESNKCSCLDGPRGRWTRPVCVNQQDSDVEPSTAASKQPDRDVKLSTAASLSARFPLISPEAEITPTPESGEISARLVDGGYFENYGATSLLDLVNALHSIDEKQPIRVVLITNDPAFEPMECVEGERLPMRPKSADHLILLAYRSIVKAALSTREARGASAAIALCHLQKEHDDSFTHIGTETKLTTMPQDPCETYGNERSEQGTESAVSISMSWWLSYPAQQFLHRRVKNIPVCGNQRSKHADEKAERQGKSTHH